jgi:hypothetical protein
MYRVQEPIAYVEDHLCNVWTPTESGMCPNKAGRILCLASDDGSHVLFEVVRTMDAFTQSCGMIAKVMSNLWSDWKRKVGKTYRRLSRGLKDGWVYLIFSLVKLPSRDTVKRSLGEKTVVLTCIG